MPTHDVGVTLPAIADRCRFVYVIAGCAYGLTSDIHVADEARERGLPVQSYSRGRDCGHEWEIFLAKREPPEVDDDA